MHARMRSRLPFSGEQNMKEAEILYEALHSEFGIEVEILGNYQISLQRLYTARRKDPDLDVLQISKSPTSPTHIWIVKTDKRSEEHTSELQSH